MIKLIKIDIVCVYCWWLGNLTIKHNIYEVYLLDEKHCLPTT